MANGYLGDQRIREMETLMRQMCQRKCYDLDGLADVWKVTKDRRI